MTWRDHIKVHPAADLFPMMSDEELKVLAADIRKHKMQSPIMLWFDGKETYLLDGRNRLEALERFTKFTLWDGPSDCFKDVVNFNYMRGDDIPDPYAFVISANIHRRHLTAEQKRELIGKLLKATPEKSNRQIGELTKADHKTVGTVRTEMESTGEIPQLEKTVGKDGKARQQPAKKQPDPAPQQSAEDRKTLYANDEEQPFNGLLHDLNEYLTDIQAVASLLKEERVRKFSEEDVAEILGVTVLISEVVTNIYNSISMWRAEPEQPQPEPEKPTRMDRSPSILDFKEIKERAFRLGYQMTRRRGAGGSYSYNLTQIDDDSGVGFGASNLKAVNEWLDVYEYKIPVQISSACGTPMFQINADAPMPPDELIPEFLKRGPA